MGFEPYIPQLYKIFYNNEDASVVYQKLIFNSIIISKIINTLIQRPEL